MSSLKGKNTSASSVAIRASLSLKSSEYVRSLFLLESSLQLKTIALIFEKGDLNSLEATWSHISRSSSKLTDVRRTLASKSARV